MGLNEVFRFGDAGQFWPHIMQAMQKRSDGRGGLSVGRLLLRAMMLAAVSGCAAVSPVRNSGGFTTSLRAQGGDVELSTARPLAVSNDELTKWTQRAITALTGFYGHYPVKHVSIMVSPAPRGSVQNGQESNGNRITIRIGPETTGADLSDDWMLTHEMFHLSQPQLDGDYMWMSEGMADYLEPVARVRIGQITEERFWKDLVEGLPQGLPGPGDGGLDGSQSWGRTYWGGSLFWLMADVGVRQRTGNQKSVRDAAKAVLDAGGDGSGDWSIDKLLSAYDKGTGTMVFKELHDQFGAKPGHVDLNDLWKSLGVVYSDGRISFDDKAPLAGIRKGITAP